MPAARVPQEPDVGWLLGISILWTLGIVLAAVSIVLGAFQLFNGNPGSLVSILIAGGITYYLFQPEVKAAFGRT